MAIIAMTTRSSMSVNPLRAVTPVCRRLPVLPGAAILFEFINDRVEFGTGQRLRRAGSVTRARTRVNRRRLGVRLILSFSRSATKVKSQYKPEKPAEKRVQDHRRAVIAVRAGGREMEADRLAELGRPSIAGARTKQCVRPMAKSSCLIGLKRVSVKPLGAREKGEQSILGSASSSDCVVPASVCQLTVIAAYCECAPQRIAQIEKQALRKMRAKLKKLQIDWTRHRLSSLSPALVSPNTAKVGRINAVCVHLVGFSTFDFRCQSRPDLSVAFPESRH